MITIFTTTKDFVGINRSNQLNAIRSWLESSFKPQVVVFGIKNELNDLVETKGLVMVDQISVSPTGAPLASEMFDAVSRISKFDICCYMNADIILTDSFFETVQLLARNLKERYLLVGERLDVHVNEEISFSKEWEKDFSLKYSNELKIHRPDGSDFFVFPKGQYSKANMPLLHIGRPGWDLWMIYHSRKSHYRTIDISQTVRVIHQNHDYSHKQHVYSSVADDPEANVNLALIPADAKYLFTLKACNYCYSDGKLIPNFYRGDFDKYLNLQNILFGSGFIRKVRSKIDRIRFKIINSVFLSLLFSPKRKFNIGAGRFEYRDGWLCTDRDSLDITKSGDWYKHLRFLKLDNIFAEHVWEHLAETDTLLANKNCCNFLKRGGILRLAVPDGYHPDKAYIDRVKPGGNGPGAEDHKILYNYTTMRVSLEQAGFKVNLLEYWDENGQFHFTDWSNESGKVLRSKRYDDRNIDAKLNYTSLIVDALK